ncbi:hypothetical protein [Streptomyces inhibens]|uniref:hypothetical protein n=1 Tax=Streptomyces inhibens TaxID=2293571 RepID=UPI001EE6EAFB|nr:hypothetical protein [Streptomyces inhibens]UKY53276.1 hypothetical protein KI385_33700 [Streptomyces inhibens]
MHAHERRVTGEEPASRAPTRGPEHTRTPASALSDRRPHTLRTLQRTAGNAGVARALGPGPGQQSVRDVQRYVAGEAALGFDKVSTNGRIAVRGRYEAYAEADMITAAARVLDTQDRVAITLERGAAVQAGERTLHRVLPVYKDEARAAAAVRAAGRDPAGAGHEPVRGDSAAQREDKRAAYQRSLAEPREVQQLIALTRRIVTARQARDEPSRGVVAGLRAEAMTLAMATMGGGWVAGRFPYPERTGRDGLTDLATLMPGLTADVLSGFPAVEYQESRVHELLITLPNDCQGAAAQLIGRPADGGLSVRREAPAVGENHFIDLTGAAADGWANHFAAVVLRDGDDTLTYETAADRASTLQHGKSLGYFALYGRAGSDQSFDSVIRAQNLDYAARAAAPA